MSDKHVGQRIAIAHLIARSSPCPRAQVGAVIFHPESWAIVSDGYNGPPRGGGHLCGGDVCHRTERGVASGERCEVGCHHAETNALMNALRHGAATLDAWMVTTRAPCLMCAKAVHHAGITRVYCPPEEEGDGGEGGGDGVKYLKRHKVEVITFSG